MHMYPSAACLSYIHAWSVGCVLSLLSQDKCEEYEDRKKMESCFLHLQIFEENFSSVLFQGVNKYQWVQVIGGGPFGLDY